MRLQFLPRLAQHHVGVPTASQQARLDLMKYSPPRRFAAPAKQTLCMQSICFKRNVVLLLLLVNSLYCLNLYVFWLTNNVQDLI